MTVKRLNEGSNTMFVKIETPVQQDNKMLQLGAQKFETKAQKV